MTSQFVFIIIPLLLPLLVLLLLLTYHVSVDVAFLLSPIDYNDADFLKSSVILFLLLTDVVAVGMPVTKTNFAACK